MSPHGNHAGTIENESDWPAALLFARGATKPIGSEMSHCPHMEFVWVQYTIQTDILPSICVRLHTEYISADFSLDGWILEFFPSGKSVCTHFHTLPHTFSVLMGTCPHKEKKFRDCPCVEGTISDEFHVGT